MAIERQITFAVRRKLFNTILKSQWLILAVLFSLLKIKK